MSGKDVKALKEDEKLIEVEGASSNDRVVKWNLRDRKATQLRNAETLAGTSGKRKREKQEKDLPKISNFSLELKSGEIVEDIFAVTGKMPSRKRNKREKSVQKQIDQISPGGSLEKITLDRYKVSETTSRNNKNFP